MSIKTIIAFISAAVAVHNGYQAVILAPTEVLAEQHYNNSEKFFSKLKINVCLLTGSITKKNKEIIKEKLVNGEIDIIIGTHALIEEDVEFKKLGFIIADEQCPREVTAAKERSHDHEQTSPCGDGRRYGEPVRRPEAGGPGGRPRPAHHGLLHLRRPPGGL